MIAPTLTYPNGGESIFARSIPIQWDASAYDLQGTEPIWYEVLFTDSWDATRKVDWVQIASVPSTASSFLWNVPFPIRGNNCRLGIRARNSMGVRTDINISANNFNIQERSITTPVVVSPVNNESYHQYVPIILDHSAILGTYSQRAMYQIYYSSQSNDIDWTVLRENVVVGSDPFVWDVRELLPGADYSIKVILQDDRGNSSTAVYINNINIISSIGKSM